MLKSKDLTKIRVVGIKSSLKQFIEELHSLKLMHLTDFKKDSNINLDIGTSFEEATEYSELLIDLRFLIDSLKLKSENVFDTKISLSEKKKAKKLIESLKELLEQKNSLFLEKNNLNSQI